MILAKSSGESLSQHTIKCLKVAKILIDSLPMEDERREALKNDVFLALAMHDVGKAAEGFQRVLRGEKDNWQGKRHEIISASFASSLKDIPPAVIFAVLTHHRSIPSDGISQVFGCLPDEQIPFSEVETHVWKEMAIEWEKNITLFTEEWKTICDYLGASFAPLGLKPLSLQSSWLERTVARRGQRRSISFQDRYYASIVRGLTIASDHLGSMNKFPPAIPELRRVPILKHNPRPFQEQIGKINKSAILRAPTGSGKTEAALLWAQTNQRNNGRLFYILPYTASINAMHRRLARIFGHIQVGILHHRATESLYSMLENDSTSSLEKQDIAKTLAELAHEMWFPIRVCTPHQILRYTLRGKGWEYMLAEFPNACFIFDEIHAYDPRIVGLTLASAKLASQWGTKCLFLSATLPEFLRKLIITSIGKIPFIQPDPAQEEDKKILEKKRHIVEMKNGSIIDQIETIIRLIPNCSSTLIVCNHVRTAQEMYTLLKREFPRENIRLIHGRFNQEDRNTIENEIINNVPPKVLIATQVVEVSLDVDFERSFFEPAPVDALIQRMGRVNRSGSRPPAKVVIFTQQVNPHRLYCDCSAGSHGSTCKVKLTMDELQKIENPLSEKELIEMANRVYGEGYQGEDRIKFDQGLHHPDIMEFQDRLLAGTHQDWVEEVVEKTDGIVEVLPRCLSKEYKVRREEGLWIEANSLLVPIRRKSLAWLKTKVDTSHDPWIAEFKYTSEKGLEMQ